MTEKDEYIRYRTKIGFCKFPDYLKYMKEIFPNEDLHHLFSSIGKIKFTDAFVYPFEHFYHLNTVHKRKAKFCLLFLEASFKYFTQYCIEKNLCTIEELPKDLEPESIAIFIECIYRRIKK